jgi:hypothetical protein
MCTNFKASIKTNLTHLGPNHLHHATHGTSDYRLALKHNTLLELKLIEQIDEHSSVTLLKNSGTYFLSTEFDFQFSFQATSNIR